MQAVGRLGSYISQGVYTVSGPFHPFGGAVDIVVVEQPDGSFKSSPWYVRFGKFQGVLKAREKVVNICVNGVEVDFKMYLDHKGEAFFLREIDADTKSILITRPSSVDDVDDHSSLDSKSCDFDSKNGKIVSETNSKRSRILGFVFGRRSLKKEVHDGGINRVGSLERAEIAADLLELNWSTKLSGKHRQNIQDASSVGTLEMPMDDELLHRGESYGEVCFDIAHDGEGDLNRKEVACVEVEACVEKPLNEEEVSVSTFDDALGSDISDEEIIQSSRVGLDLDCPSEQVHEVLYLTDGESGEIHVHDEVFHGATKLLPEVQKIYCFDSGVSVNNDVDVEDRISSRKLQNGNTGLGHCSSDNDELKYVTKPSSYYSQNGTTLDENNMNEKDFVCSLSSPPNCLDTCLPREAVRRSLSQSSVEENFFFSDLDERGTYDQFEGSFSPEYIGQENHLSYDNDTEKLRVTSIPIAIPKNEDAREEKGKQTGSLPNVSSSSKNQGQHDVRYPFSQSLDSTFLGINDMKGPKSDEDKESQLLHEELGAKDYHNSGNLESTVLKLPPGDSSTQNPSSGGNWKIWPFNMKRSGSGDVMPPIPRNAKNTSFDNSYENTINTDVNKNVLKPNLMKKKVRETTPTSEQLASLNLKEGSNIVTFTFSTAVLGKQQVDARIYLWKWNTRIVVSDVDGTITKSDVLGQFMPLVGIDWSQTGVAHLFSAIKENGYQLLFLSARSISQAYLTRQFLLNLKQDGKILPDGPVVISPDGLFPSLYREVIKRVPHEFKIACLESIGALFPSDCSPFYAGFGNRDTDEISYLKVGIPKGKIFIINPRGEVVVNRRVDSKSYTSLHALVHGMFPPTNSSEQEDYNSWNFWKLPPPSIDI